MNSAAPVSLYDTAPLLPVMLVGVLVAVLPMLWVALRSRQSSATGRLQALTLVTLFLTFDLVMFGAFTRLTDSGLGCPDWPGCYASASPLGAHQEISNAQTALPSGPVTHQKAWIEMVHRYLATGVGVLIVAITTAAWWLRRAPGLAGSGLHWLATLTLAWVCMQGAFGALTVTMKLFPAIVSLHLLGGYGLLALLAWLVVRSRQAGGSRNLVSMPDGLRPLIGLGLLIVILQAASGAWVSTNYAVLACQDFPLCQGQWWPAMDFEQAFTLWRPLGLNPDGSSVSFQAITAIHIAHRVAAMFTGSALLVLSWYLSRHPELVRASRWLAGLVGLQIATGLSNVVLGWPLLAAVLHTGGAGAIVALLSWMLASTRGLATVRARRDMQQLRAGYPE
jgi:cytochrome c oxidase assembly protein subunit 15